MRKLLHMYLALFAITTLFSCDHSDENSMSEKYTSRSGSYGIWNNGNERACLF